MKQIIYTIKQLAEATDSSVAATLSKIRDGYIPGPNLSTLGEKGRVFYTKKQFRLALGVLFSVKENGYLVSMGASLPVEDAFAKIHKN